jgi:argininosuccinate lyase
MQEDKELIFDAIDTVKVCLEVFTPMLATLKTLPQNTLKAAQKGFINATDLADYLTKKGMPFRMAYKIVGTLVAECIQKDCVLENLPLEDYQKHSELFQNDLYQEIALKTCVEKRNSAGGASPKSVRDQIAWVKKQLG